MEIWRQLSPATIRLDIQARDKAEVFGVLVEALTAAGKAGPGLPLLEEVLRREQVLSTGVGNGVALPHARLDGFPGFALAFGRPVRPLDVGAVDGRPADLFFLLIADRRDPSTIVRILGRLARLCDDAVVREGLRKVTTPEETIDWFRRMEEKAAGDPRGENRP
jgi:mannitol/fructose-specific phosphotransferase system IIA component (Ntr-type)